MDKQTESELEKIGKEVPHHLMERVMRKRGPDELDEKLKEITLWNLNKVEDPLKRKEIQHYLDNEASPNEYVSDPEAEREIHRYWQTKIERGIRQGKIKPYDPKKDSFMRYINSKKK